MWRTRRTTLQLNWPLGYMILRQTLSFLIHFAYYSTGQVRENETSRTLGLRLKASFRIPDVENRSFIEHIHDLLSVWMTTSKSTETSSANRPSFLHFLPEQSMYLPNPSGLDMDKFINRNYPTTKTLRRSSKLLRFNNDLSFTSNFCGSWISSNISLLSWSFALCKELISRVYSSVAKKHYAGLWIFQQIFLGWKMKDQYKLAIRVTKKETPDQAYHFNIYYFIVWQIDNWKW